MARVAFSQIAPSALLRQTMGFQASPPSLATFRIDATRCVTPLMRLSPVDRPSAHHFCRVSALDSVRMRRHPGRFAPSISADHLYEMPTNRQLGCRERLSDQSALLLREFAQMAACVYCTSETKLHEGGVPVCPSCSEARTKRRPPATEQVFAAPCSRMSLG